MPGAFYYFLGNGVHKKSPARKPAQGNKITYPATMRAESFLLFHRTANVVDGLPDSVNFFRFVVRNLDFELVCEFHNQFRDIHRIGAQVVQLRSSGGLPAIGFPRLPHFLS